MVRDGACSRVAAVTSELQTRVSCCLEYIPANVVTKHTLFVYFFGTYSCSEQHGVVELRFLSARLCSHAF